MIADCTVDIVASIPASAVLIASTRFRSRALLLLLWKESCTTAIEKKRTTTEIMMPVTMASPRSSFGCGITSHLLLGDVIADVLWIAVFSVSTGDRGLDLDVPAG